MSKSDFVIEAHNVSKKYRIGSTRETRQSLQQVMLDSVLMPMRRVASLRRNRLPTDADRELIRQAIAAQPAKHVLVTHGTDSMVETAKVLASLTDRTIVLTGALNPARFRGSDAEFNIGTAVGAVQSLPPGVYIAMNGRVWRPDQVRKNVAANRFEAV